MESVDGIENVAVGGYALPVKTIREMICGSIDVIVQASRLRDGSRKITHITEVLNMEQDTVIMQDIFLFVQDGIDENGRAYGHFEATGVRPSFMQRIEQGGVRLPANLFAARTLGR